MRLLAFHLLLFLLIALAALFQTGCQREPEQFELVSPSQTGITFANTITTNDSLNALSFDYIYNGGGVAVGDVNNDGLPDLYFSGNMVSGRLYLNKGNMQFEDATQKAGVSTSRWTTGVSMVDINGDGWLDMYVCTASRDTTQSANLFFINNGDGTFTDRAKEYGVADTGYSTQAAFFDYDKDGDLDMYLLTNGYEGYNRNLTRPKKLHGEGTSTDRLYRNDTPHPPTPSPAEKGSKEKSLSEGKAAYAAANGFRVRFTNVSREAGITIEGYGLGIAVSDINQDGWQDLYVANDFITNDLMWINNGNGTFTDRAAAFLKHQSHNGMGTDVADFNNDGLVDIVVLDMLPEDNLRQKTMFPATNHDRFDQVRELGYLPQYVRNSLQLNNGNGSFSEIGQLAGISNTDWSWSALFADYDNDGLRDLLITNGYRKDVTDLDFITYSRERSMFGTDESKLKNAREELAKLKGAHVHNYLYKNNGDLTFTDKSESWGFGEPTYSNGAAYADLDRDGDLDLVINNIDQEASVYRNNADKINKASYLQIKLVGTDLNRSGLGAKITVRYGHKQQFYEQSPYRGYKSTVEDVAHFGLGAVPQVDSVEITWPDGKYQLLRNVQANQRITVKYADAKLPAAQPEHPAARPVLANVSTDYDLHFKHQEVNYVDFKIQPLLPHKFSQNGPGVAVGDVDSNGLDDVYVGGAAGQPGKLFRQTESGKFTSQDIPKKREEDMGSLFFDVDSDGDLDLYVVSGGSEFPENSEHYQDRLYFNDGKGNFTHTPSGLPPMRTSGSCVTAADYDRDGDLDLFVGGRVVPGNYPMPARSYLLRNDQGRFTDVTAQVAPGLQQPGLVTSALWTDFNNDGQTDLLVAGEWMPLTFFENQNGKLTPNHAAAQSLNHSSGWWNSLAAADFDHDGDVDYVAGNLGLNSKYKASPDEPVCIYAKDYDQNGSLDPVLCHYVMGKNYPTHPRDVLIDQINGMRGRFPRYATYGEATLDKVFSEEELKDAYVVRSEYFQSAYVENLGNGTFKLRPLPKLAQVAPVYGMLCKDVDGDGNVDVLLAGNSYAPETLSGWYDAGIGLYLKGDGKGSFTPVPVQQSGFFVDGDAKSIAELSTGNGNSLILVSCNNDSLQVFAPVQKPAIRSVALKPMDASAEITFRNGKREKCEFYYGSAYLSQSSRMLNVPDNAASVTIRDFAGKARTIIPDENLRAAKQ